MPLRPEFILYFLTCTRRLWLCAHAIATEEDREATTEFDRKPRGLRSAAPKEGMVFIQPFDESFPASAQEWMLRYRVKGLLRRGIPIQGAFLRMGSAGPDLPVALGPDRDLYLTHRLLPALRAVLALPHPPSCTVRLAACASCPFDEYCHIREAA